MSRGLHYDDDGNFIGMAAETRAGEPADRPLDDYTVAELKDHAEARGIDLGDATKKADIIEAIEAV